MAGDGSPPDSAFTGWRYYFNTYTQKGRKNIALTTYAGFFLGIMIWRLKAKKKKAIEERKH
uniref:Hypotheticial protein n=1 Tax=Schistosoma japonicum TaxID=6182 RepID=C1LQ96_SCHJA|nr:hypotheticial protein [Schistosoma japonicum]CAX76869.1 hypotheticial protein [Schistosoma japonicum]CAX76870.1 hypotheticial protein [Schistosoma japonicum]CAX76871.1 hypotheticial protein [Schistosoma japonicum]CAX76872.1 hypotheticial protein [Schistosoma japonicum]